MRSNFVRITAVIFALLLTHAGDAQVRGKGRLQGVISEKGSGKPVAGATVTISGGNTQPIVVKTNAKGQWSAIGLTSGTWDIDITADGYEAARGTTQISELQMAPPIKSELARKVVEEPVAPAAPAISAVPEAVVAAVNEAQELLRIAVGDVVTRTDTGADGQSTSVSHTVTADDVKANSRRAAALIADALPQIPVDTPERQQIRAQLQQLLAQAHYKGGELAKAIEIQRGIFTADESNTANALLLVNLYLENGQLPEGRALLEKLPAEAVTDPTVYTNVGILFLNKDSAADAVKYFDRAIALDGTKADGYFYRGLAHVQLKNNDRAKADFQKVVALAPDSAEARDAMQLLAGLK